MIKLETHCHSAGSWCATCGLEGLIKEYKNANYGGVVITNHYSEYEFRKHGFSKQRDYAKYYLELIDKAMDLGDKQGLKVFYGIEVKLNELSTEYVLYGFTREFLLDNANLYEFSQERLFKTACSNAMLMYQSHPFREGVRVGNPKFMHGAEYFNGHFHHVNNNALAREFCQKHNLIKLSGTDFHDKNQAITAGIYIPENVKDSFELAKFIQKNQFELIEERETYVRELIKYKFSDEGRVIKENELKE